MGVIVGSEFLPCILVINTNIWVVFLLTETLTKSRKKWHAYNFVKICHSHTYLWYWPTRLSACIHRAPGLTVWRRVLHIHGKKDACAMHIHVLCHQSYGSKKDACTISIHGKNDVDAWYFWSLVSLDKVLAYLQRKAAGFCRYLSIHTSVLLAGRFLFRPLYRSICYEHTASLPLPMHTSKLKLYTRSKQIKGIARIIKLKSNLTS